MDAVDQQGARGRWNEAVQRREVVEQFDDRDECGDGDRTEREGLRRGLEVGWHRDDEADVD